MSKCLLITFLNLLTIVLNAQKQGIATHFEALGTPYGGCGVPTDLVESEHFVALNVFNRPNYAGKGDFTRPLKGADTLLMGEFQNGKNCGRWVKVKILDDCKGGSNSGIIGETPCNGVWTSDSYNGAELYMIITDACGDNNAWCREIQSHLDLHTSSLNQFEKNGITVNDIYPTSFNNRKIEWEYVPAPNYTGDINIHFIQNSQKWWGGIIITNLPNGIHGVEQKINNQWISLDMNSDMGQAYLLKNYDSPITIRVYDADDQLLFKGREYQFNNLCFNQPCTAVATEISYQKTDCNGDMGGTASVDQCNICSGGNTGLAVDNCITSFDSDIKKQQISIYPNPASDQLHVLAQQADSWMITDVVGNELLTGYGQEINIDALTPGIYTLRYGNQITKVVKK